MDLGRGEKHMDAPALAGGFYGGAGGVNILGHAPRQAGDLGAFHLFGDGLHGRKIALADHREASLDDIHLEGSQLLRHREFFAEVHGRTGALLAVTESGVEDQDSIFAHSISFAAGCLPKKEPHRQLGDGASEIVIRLNPNRPAAKKQRPL